MFEMTTSSKKRAFTLTEFLIAIVIVGIIAALILPAYFGKPSNSTQIAEGLKSDISKAFQLATSRAGMIQSSNSPTMVVEQALKLSNGVLDGNYETYKTSTNWTVKVPTRWTPQASGPDKATIKLVSDTASNNYSFDVFRDNTTSQSVELAEMEPPTVAPGQPTPGPSEPPAPTPVPPHVPTPSPVTSDVHFIFAGSNQPVTTFAITLTCTGSPAIPTLNSPVKNITLPRNLSCTATASNLSDGSTSYTALPKSFATNTQTVNVTIDVQPVSQTVPVTFAFTGTGATGINQYTLAITCPQGPSPILTNTLQTNLQANQTGCQVVASNLFDGLHHYANVTKTFNTGSAATNVSIAVTQVPNMMRTTFLFKSTLGGLIIMKTVQGSIKCGNLTTPLGFIVVTDIKESSTCQATFTNLSDFSNNTYQQTVIPQTFTIPASQVNNTSAFITINVKPYMDFSSMTKVNIVERDQGGSFAGQFINYCGGSSQSNLFYDIQYDLASYWAKQYGNNNCSGTGSQKWVDMYYSSMSGGYSYFYDMNGNLVSTGVTGNSDNHSIGSSVSVYLPDGSPSNMSTAARYAVKKMYPTWSSAQIEAYIYNVTYQGSHPDFLVDIVSLYNTRFPETPVYMVYTNPTDNKKYLVNTAWYRNSPIKIALNGVDAVVTDRGSFKFDVDGFHKNKTPIMQTTGGLEPNEAWLVLDRGNTGIVKNGIIDSDAVFGDHMGSYISGYEDLATAFNDSLEQSKHGVRYLALKPCPWWEMLWRNILKLFGFKIKPNAYADLKLLTYDNKLIDANTVINRIDVTYHNVKEFSPSGANAIFQRSTVYYLNGKKAQSGDMWFAPQFYYKLTPAGTLKFKK